MIASRPHGGAGGMGWRRAGEKHASLDVYKSIPFVSQACGCNDLRIASQVKRQATQPIGVSALLPVLMLAGWTWVS